MKTWFVIVGILAALPAFAQHHGAHGATAHAAPAHSGYAGMQSRAIKALSEQQIADLRAGRGMGLALPAELNGYPGPVHTLELAAALGLSGEQTRRTRALFEHMQAEAIRLGERLIERERALEALFKARRATVAAVEGATLEAARAQGELRAHHLRYHLSMLEVLTPAQAAQYSELRGYR